MNDGQHENAKAVPDYGATDIKAAPTSWYGALADCLGKKTLAEAGLLVTVVGLTVIGGLLAWTQQPIAAASVAVLIFLLAVLCLFKGSPDATTPKTDNGNPTAPGA